MKEYDFDIAISFSDKDINIALCIYLALKLNGLGKKTFYYKDSLEQSGKSLNKELPKIYGLKSKYVISIVSKNYAKRSDSYSKIELNSIIKRWKSNESDTFWIPILIDEKTLNQFHNDLTEDIAYLKWEMNPEQLAIKIREMLGKPILDAKKIAITQTAKNIINVKESTIEKINVVSK